MMRVVTEKRNGLAAAYLAALERAPAGSLYNIVGQICVFSRAAGTF